MTTTPNQKKTPTKKPLRKKRWRRWLAGCILVFLALLGIGIFVDMKLRYPEKTNRTQFPDYSALATRILATERLNLQYPTEEEIHRFPILWPTMEPEENALGDYLDAMNLLSLENPPAGSTFSKQDEKRVPYDDNIIAFGDWIKANEQSLQKIRQATKYEYLGLPVLVLSTTEDPIPNLEFLRTTRKLGMLSKDAALYAEIEGRTDDAVEYRMDCLRMGRHMRRGPLVRNLAGIALTAMGEVELSRQIANGSVSEARLRDIIAFCKDEPSVVDEIAFVLDAEMEWYQSHSTAKKGLAGLLTDQWSGLRSSRRNMVVPLSELFQNKDYLKTIGSRTGGSGMKGAIWRWRHELALRQIRMEALKTRAALALFQKSHGNFPEKLDELVPEILPQVPLDPYTGQPFHYKRDDTRWELRSTGPDLQFDEKLPTWSQVAGNFWVAEMFSYSPNPENPREYLSEPCDYDYIIMSVLNNNIDMARNKQPQTEEEWYRLHPEDRPSKDDSTLPGRPSGLPTREDE